MSTAARLPSGCTVGSLKRAPFERCSLFSGIAIVQEKVVIGFTESGFQNSVVQNLPTVRHETECVLNETDFRFQLQSAAKRESLLNKGPGGCLRQCLELTGCYVPDEQLHPRVVPATVRHIRNFASVRGYYRVKN